MRVERHLSIGLQGRRSGKAPIAPTEAASVMRRTCLVVLVIAWACRASPLPTASRSGPSSDRLPTLTLHHVSHDVDASPPNLDAGFRIGPQGIVVSQYDAGDGMLFSIIDTAGTIVGRFGRIGDGPGEMRGGGLTDVSDSAIIIDDESHSRLDRFALDGRLLASVHTAQPLIARVAVSDHEVLILLPSKEADFPALASAKDGSIRQLVPGDDSFIRSAFAARTFINGSVISSKLPALGRWPAGFIVADGWEYRLALYDWDGRLRRVLRRDLPRPRLSPARIAALLSEELPFASRYGPLSGADTERLRAEIAARRQPFFPHSRLALGLDAQGRIWVVGIEADSAFADIFNQNRFIGRIGLPCPGFRGGWSVHGSWLALACAPDDAAFDGDAVFKVFRIVD
jgi:hypothetical protein